MIIQSAVILGANGDAGATVLDFTPYANVPFSPWIVVILGIAGLALMYLSRCAMTSAMMWIMGMLGCGCLLVATVMGLFLTNYETRGWTPSWLAPHFSLSAVGDGHPTDKESQRWKTPSGTTLDHCTAHETVDHALSLHPFQGHYSLTCRDISTGKNVAITKNGSTQEIKEDK